MTISSTKNKAILYGNGVATGWPYKFLIPNASQLSVIVTDPNGNQTPLSSSQYAVSGIGSRNGGTVTYPLSGSPLAIGWSITILRTLPIVQQTDIVNQNGFYPDVVESAMDYQTMTQQQLAEQQTRSIAFPVVDDQTAINPVLPAAAARATKPLIFDSAGNVAAGQQPYEEPQNIKDDCKATAEGLVSGVVGGYGYFLQDGDGAVPLTFQQKMRQAINAEDYGCVGDAVIQVSPIASPNGYTYYNILSGTDNASKIVKLLTYCIATGKRLVFGPGIFRVASSIAALFGSFGPVIEGAGMGRTIFAIDHFDHFMYFTGNSTLMGASAYAGFSFIRKDPRNAPSANYGRKGLYTSCTNNAHIEDVESAGAIGFGIQFDLSSNIVGRNPFVHDHLEGVSGTDGFHLYRCNKAKVTHGRAHHISDDAFSAGSYDTSNPSNLIEYIGNTIEDCTGTNKFYGCVTGGKIESAIAYRTVMGAAQYRSDPNNVAYNASRFQFIDITCYDQQGGGGSAGAASVLAPDGYGAGLNTTCVISDFLIEDVKSINGSRAVAVSAEGNAYGKRIMRNFTIRDVDNVSSSAHGVFINGWDTGYTLEGTIRSQECGFEGVHAEGFVGTADANVVWNGQFFISGASKASPGTYRGVWMRDGNSLVKFASKASIHVANHYSTASAYPNAVVFGSGNQRSSFVNVTGITFDATVSAPQIPSSYRANRYSSFSAPSSGTWFAGDEIQNTLTYKGRWRFYQSGTFGTISGITGGTTAGSNVVPVNALSDGTNEIQVGDSVSVVGAGASGGLLVGQVLAINRSTPSISLNVNASTAVSGAVVQYNAPAYYTVTDTAS